MANVSQQANVSVEGALHGTFNSTALLISISGDHPDVENTFEEPLKVCTSLPCLNDIIVAANVCAGRCKRQHWRELRFFAMHVGQDEVAMGKAAV